MRPSNEAFSKKKTKVKKKKRTETTTDKDEGKCSSEIDIESKKTFMSRHQIWCDLKERCFEERAKQKRQVYGSSRIVLQADIDNTKKRNKKSAAKIMKG